MMWVLVEAGLALVFLVLIVWWTMPRSRDSNKQSNSK